jgi:hypothetical protein
MLIGWVLHRFGLLVGFILYHYGAWYSIDMNNSYPYNFYNVPKVRIGVLIRVGSTIYASILTGFGIVSVFLT